MPEGHTTILIKKDDEKEIYRIKNDIDLLNVGDLEEVVYDDEGIYSLSFEHNGLYSPSKFNKIIKSQCKEFEIELLRAIHVDEYGTEIFWIYKDGKFRKYEHDQDSQGPDVVKAYRHWHSGLEGLWFGGFSEDEIDVMSQRYGQFDENGRKSKYDYEDYRSLIKTGEDFLKKDVRAPYASSIWDYHVPVYESFAKYYAEKSEVKPEDGSFRYVRNYYFPNFLGYAWKWVSGGQEVVLLLTFPGDLGMDRNLIVNTGKLTIDQLIILDKYGYLSEGEVTAYDFTQHVTLYDPFYNESFIPPSTDYLYQSIPENFRLLKDEYNFDGMTINITCDLERSNDGSYLCSGYTPGGQSVCVIVYDKEFCKKLDRLPSEKYMEREFYDLEKNEVIIKNIIYCEIQVVFDEDLNIRRVLRGDVIAIVDDPKKGKAEKVFNIAA